MILFCLLYDIRRKKGKGYQCDLKGVSRPTGTIPTSCIHANPMTKLQQLNHAGDERRSRRSVSVAQLPVLPFLPILSTISSFCKSAASLRPQISPPRCRRRRPRLPARDTTRASATRYHLRAGGPAVRDARAKICPLRISRTLSPFRR